MTAPAFGIGAVIAGEGVVMGANGAANLMSGKGRVEAKSLQERADKLNSKNRDGKDFTPAGKEVVREQNATNNGGDMRCENCGTHVVKPSQHQLGQTPPSNEAHVDHKIPKSKNGSGTPANGQVLCRGCNLEKSDH